MTAMATETSLTFSSKSLINFQDRSYRWIDSKEFAFTPAIASDEQILTALIENRQYRDHYASEDSHEHDSGTVHGPYLIERMSSASFQRIDAHAASETLDNFCSLNNSPPPESIQERITAQVKAGFATADAFYRTFVACLKQRTRPRSCSGNTARLSSSADPIRHLFFMSWPLIEMPSRDRSICPRQLISFR